jgi:hypothetical protein
MSPEQRLPEHIKSKILEFPEYRMGAHRVSLVLKDGRVVDDVVVAWGDEIVRVGDDDEMDFRPEDVVDATSSA